MFDALTFRLELVTKLHLDRLSIVAQFTESIMVHVQGLPGRCSANGEDVHHWLPLRRNVLVVVAVGRESVVLFAMLTIKVVPIGHWEFVHSAAKPTFHPNRKNRPVRTDK